MECVGAFDKGHDESCGCLEVVDTCPLSSSPCTALDRPSPFLSKKGKMRFGKPPSFRKPNRPPPIIQILPFAAPQQDDQLSEDSSWIVLESPAREQRVFTEPQHGSTFEIISPENIELANIATVSGGAGINDVILLGDAPRIVGSMPNESIPSGRVHPGAEIMNVPVHLRACLSPGDSHVRWGGEILDDGGVGGACGAGEEPNRPGHHERSLSSMFSPGHLVFPHPGVLLGVGAFGKVYKATYRDQDVAVKDIDPNLSTIDMMESLRNELEVLSELEPHDNVVTCLGGCVNLQCCYIVEELMDTDLHQLIHPNGAGMGLDAPPRPLPIMQVLQVGIDIAQGLAHLHPQVLHRDLKPKNILIKNGVAKVADFGLSKSKKESYLSSDSGMTGTVEYMSPETMKGRINHKSDVYSLGVLLWECVTGLKPYLDIPVVFAIVFAVGAKGRRPDFPSSVNCPPALRTLIESCWRDDPHERPECVEIIEKLKRIKKCLSGD
ncbi:hypothetical protein BSKO_10563 [Bryopsis sp. KO-2023]|nr:hypothetical protein BSKO_10563 [Bryopsis sp. KO-2023]